jgi:hypothetical protein
MREPAPFVLRTPPVGGVQRARPSASSSNLSTPHRRGGRAVECAGLENRFGSFGPTRVRIPPSPLCDESGHRSQMSRDIGLSFGGLASGRVVPCKSAATRLHGARTAASWTSIAISTPPWPVPQPPRQPATGVLRRRHASNLSLRSGRRLFRRRRPPPRCRGTRARRGFIDAEVTRLQTNYEVPPDVDVAQLVHTEQQRILLEETGLRQTRPDAVIEFSLLDGYAQLSDIIKAHGYDLARQRGTVPTPGEVAGDWYDSVYLPGVQAARDEGLAQRYESWGMTNADLFLWLYQLLRDLRAYSTSPVLSCLPGDESQRRRALGR